MADTRHGGAYDRGSADAYYGRARRPHFFVGTTYNSAEVTDLTPEQIADYNAGYNNQTDFKVWE